MEYDVGSKYTLQVDIEKYGGDEWKPDLLKLYWQNVGTMTCKICDDCTDGYGVALKSGIFHFECSILTTLRTGLESIEVTGCQGYENYNSADKTKLRICKSSKQGFIDIFGKYSLDMINEQI